MEKVQCSSTSGRDLSLEHSKAESSRSHDRWDAEDSRPWGSNQRLDHRDIISHQI